MHVRNRPLLLLVAMAVGVAPPGNGQADSTRADSTAPYRNRWIALPYAGYAPETGVQFGAAGGWQFKIRAGASDPGTRPSFLAGNLFGTTKGNGG